MKTPYYNFPVDFSGFMTGSHLPLCSLKASIDQHVQLIIATRLGEHRSDPTYGCEIWDLDFQVVLSAGLWEDKLRQSLLETIKSHEKRLCKVEIKVKMTDAERHSILNDNPEMKKKVLIEVMGTMSKTGEAYSYKTNLFLSPLSEY